MEHDWRDQSAYWDAVAEAKHFSHPLPVEWLPASRFGEIALDVGCGYGRTVAELVAAGYDRAVGVDTSRRMIERGRAARPDLDLRAIEAGASLPFRDRSVALALLFAVLTCTPDRAEQRARVAEVRRVLRPGGLLIVSDLPLQAGARAERRYAEGSERFGQRGVFRLPDGGVMRHHAEGELEALVAPQAGFELVAQRELETLTMNGNPCRIVQLLARRSE